MGYHLVKYKNLIKIADTSFNDQDQQDARDLDLNYFNGLNSNSFDIPYVLEENVKRYLK